MGPKAGLWFTFLLLPLHKADRSFCFLLSLNKLLSAHTHPQHGDFPFFSLVPVHLWRPALPSLDLQHVAALLLISKAISEGSYHLLGIAEVCFPPHVSKGLFPSPSFYLIWKVWSSSMDEVYITWWRGVHFPPRPVMKPKLMEEQLILTILLVIGVYLLRKLLKGNRRGFLV